MESAPCRQNIFHTCLGYYTCFIHPQTSKVILKLRHCNEQTTSQNYQAFWLTVVCETKWNEMKWKSVVCEIIPAFIYLYKTLNPLCSKVNKKATIMYFIGSFKYRVTFLVKIRRFNGHRKWTSCIVGQCFLGKFSGKSSL